MDTAIFETLYGEGLITETELSSVQQQPKLVNLHWELRTLLYLGILLLTSGLSILIYKNLDTIGHTVIIVFIALACAGCYMYCIKKSPGYSRQKIKSPNTWYDYIVLLGSLLLLALVAYVQYQYNLFGNKLSIAAAIPMVLLFITAYYFDHLGILSLAITNLAAWAGITATPLNMLQRNDFSNSSIIFTGLLIGALLAAAALFSLSKNIKQHFAFTYTNFGSHLLFIAGIAAMIHFDSLYFLWAIVLAGFIYLSYTHAMRQHSFYFLLITVLYGYITLSYVVIRLLTLISLEMAAVYLGFMYFIISGILLIRLLIRYNKILKNNASL